MFQCLRKGFSYSRMLGIIEPDSDPSKHDLATQTSLSLAEASCRMSPVCWALSGPRGVPTTHLLSSLLPLPAHLPGDGGPSPASVRIEIASRHAQCHSSVTSSIKVFSTQMCLLLLLSFQKNVISFLLSMFCNRH